MKQYVDMLSGTVIEPEAFIRTDAPSDNWYTPEQMTRYREFRDDVSGTLFALFDDGREEGLVWFPVEAREVSR